jgi:glutamate synthase (NADPH/NADH) small chain
VDILSKQIIPKRVGPWPYPKKKEECRAESFEEVQLGYTEEEAIEEANRCILCPVPACVKACPVNSDVLGMMKSIQERDFGGALKKIRETNCLPGSTARVCPQLDDLCEANCVLNKRGDPVSIGMLQRFVADWGHEHGKLKNPEIAESTGKRVAIIGGGPAGLAAADHLVRSGHNVTILDAHNKLGGTAMYGIPNFHLSKDLLDSEVKRLQDMGVEARINVKVGSQISLEEIFDEGFDAILIATGAKNVTPFKVEGIDLKGVYDAYKFLITLDEMEFYKHPEKSIPFQVGEKVLVVGGGDTAIDASRTSVRLGAKEVTIMYRRSDKEMTSYRFGREMAKEEGVEIKYLHVPVRFISDKDGRVKEAECVKMRLGEPDDSGRARPIPIEGSNFTIDVDTVFIAIGRGPNTYLQEKEEIKMEKWGGITINPDTYETSYSGVFAAGDVVTGETLVIKAMGEARKAAQRVHEYLIDSQERLDLFQRYFTERYGRKAVQPSQTTGQSN